jgi:hypothetical protein
LNPELPWRHAHLDALEGLRERVEAREVHLGEVVDVLAGQLLHGRDRRRLAGLVGLLVTLVMAGARVRGRAEALRPRKAVSLVNLALGLPVVGLGESNPVVAGDGDANRLLAALEDVNQDQRVGGLAADAQVLDPVDAAGVHGGEQAWRQDVAVVVGPALQPHQQDVHLAGLRTAAQGVRAFDPAELALHVVRIPRYEQYRGGDHTAHRVADLSCDHRAAVRSGHS